MGHYDDPGRPAYASVAALLRQRILSGEYRPGDQLPSAPDLMRSEGVGREVARRALRTLVGEGLARGNASRGTRVLPQPPMRVVDMTEPDPAIEARRRELGADSVTQDVSARPSRPEEQVTLGIGEQVWVLVIRTQFWAGGKVVDASEDVKPGNSATIRYGLPGGTP